MLSTAMSTPARQRRTPKARYHHRKDASRSGAELVSRGDPQIIAAQRGEAAIKVPSASVIILTKRPVAVGPKMIENGGGPNFIISSWEDQVGSTIRLRAPEREQRYPHSNWPVPGRD